MKPPLNQIAALWFGISLALCGVAYAQEPTDSGDKVRQQNRNQNLEQLKDSGARLQQYRNESRNESRRYDSQGQGQRKGQGRR